MQKERLLRPSLVDFETIPVERLTVAETWKEITGEDPASSHIQVVVPAHNEEVVIGRVLRNLTRQIIPEGARLTVDVVSNGTTDNTGGEVRKAQEELAKQDPSGSINIRFFSIEKANKAAAVNYGKSNAISDILINVDADTLPSPNSLAKIYALMRHYPDCMAASIMPRRLANDRGSSLLHGLQDYYDSFTRDNGAILGKFYAYRNGAFEDIPEDTMSDDTWLEFTCLDRYGPNGVKFLGQSTDSDVVIEYSATTSLKEYFSQLLRWESSFQHLMKTYPELKSACRMADRVEIPEKPVEVFRYLREKYPEIPFADKVAMYYLLKGIRKITKIRAVSERFGNRTSWTSPKSDRVDLD